jgi:hypothetical protein
MLLYQYSDSMFQSRPHYILFLFLFFKGKIGWGWNSTICEHFSLDVKSFGTEILRNSKNDRGSTVTLTLVRVGVIVVKMRQPNLLLLTRIGTEMQ